MRKERKMKIAFASIAAVSAALALLTSAHATPASQVPASSEFNGNMDANLLQLIQYDDYQRGGDRWRYRGGEGEGYGYGQRRYGEGEGYGGRRRYGEGEDEGYGRRRYGDGSDAHARRLRIIWCTQHPGRC
ncbi:hypothetical protein SAMN05444161_1415 [Rhizobiales bacterium GAS191]|nr:hypothetical protein SAMN05444161_1415 [Rhizobiales bacterium GAS191]